MENSRASTGFTVDIHQGFNFTKLKLNRIFTESFGNTSSCLAIYVKMATVEKVQSLHSMTLLVMLPGCFLGLTRQGPI